MASSLALALVLLAGCASLRGAQAVQQASELHEEARQDLRLGQYAKGILKARAALSLRERALGPDHPDVAATLHLLGALHRFQGRYAEAEHLYRRALVIRESAYGPSDVAVAESLNHLALLYDAQGRYGEAEPRYRQSLRLRQDVLGPDHPDVAQSLNNLGVFLQGGGDYPAARPLLERALAVWERALGPDHPDVASGLNNLALLLHATGDYAAARPLLERALAIWERALGREHPEVASGLSNLALLSQSTGDYAGARRLLERAVRIRQRALGPTHPAVAHSLGNLATVLWFAGDLPAARPLLEQALAILEHALGPTHPEVAPSLNNLARVLESSGDSEAAGRFYQRALSVYERTVGANDLNVAFTLNNLARLRHRAGDPTGARSLYERALRIREQGLGPMHPLVALSLNNLADLLQDVGDHSLAKPLYERALDIARRGAPEWEWRAALGLGRLYEREGRLMAALALYREAVHTVEGLAGQFEGDRSRAQYLEGENRLAAYDALARLLLKLHELDQTKGYDREAWAVLEAKKGRIAAEALTAARPKLRSPAGQRVQASQGQVLALERALQEERAKGPTDQRPERLQNLTTLLAQTKAEYVREVRAFLGRYPQYKTQFVDQQTVDPRALAKFADRLPSGTLAVQYFAAPDKLYLFLVTAGGGFQVKRRAVTQEELYALIGAYRQHLERGATRRLSWTDDRSETYVREVEPFKAITRALASHLLGPIEAELGAHGSLVLIPNDLLLYLPIHALTRERTDGSVRFLAETHRVSYVTQLELVDLLAPRAAGPDAPLLAMANPDGSLPGASWEVRALGRIRRAVTTLEGPQATKDRFLTLATEFPDLHLATHGVLDPERPERSYLLMAGEEEASQRLTVGEIAGLSLRNGLVILSACETALGEQVPGAGLITLAAAFSQAGAQSIVASLWKVNDIATRDFMVEFHRVLLDGEPATALQQAQQAVLSQRQNAHPYYWAPFILMGAR